MLSARIFVELFVDETRGVVSLPLPEAGTRDAKDHLVELELDWAEIVVSLLDGKALLAAADGARL